MGAELVVFPEAFIPGTPLWIDSTPIWDGDGPWYARLVEHFDFDPLLTPAGRRLGSDGATTKSMFRLRSGESIETVLIRNGRPDRQNP